MRLIWILCVLNVVAFSCTGDCKACHQNLNYVQDIRHSPMTMCKNCHTDEKMVQIDMGGCGADCFACHDIKKIQSPQLAKSHTMLNACMQCHIQLSSSPLSTGANVFQKGVKSFSDMLLAP